LGSPRRQSQAKASLGVETGVFLCWSIAQKRRSDLVDQIFGPGRCQVKRVACHELVSDPVENAMAGSSDKRIVLDTDNMRDIAATYTVGCSNAIQIKPRSNLVSISIPTIALAEINEFIGAAKENTWRPRQYHEAG
jgi:hypothetical protein